MSTRAVTWNDALELTLTTPGGETVTLDVPSMLHDAGLLSKITRVNGAVPLRISHVTGKYVGVNTIANGYCAMSGRSLVASASAREVAYKRATSLGGKRRRAVEEDDEQRPRPPTPPRPAHESEMGAQNDDDDDDCAFVKERTCDERNEEGRAHAIPLEED